MGIDHVDILAALREVRTGPMERNQCRDRVRLVWICALAWRRATRHRCNCCIQHPRCRQAVSHHAAHMLKFLLTLAVALAIGVPVDARGWGPEGHRIVAEIAERRLTPAARREALRRLAIVREKSLADVSS